MAEQKHDPENTLILETAPGKIVIALRTDVAPGHAERLKKLARLLLDQPGFMRRGATPMHHNRIRLVLESSAQAVAPQQLPQFI